MNLVLGAHEDDFEIAAEFGGDAFCGVEREVFFLLAGVGADGPAVLAAVAGVDDDGFESLGSRAGGRRRRGRGRSRWTGRRRRRKTRRGRGSRAALKIVVME